MRLETEEQHQRQYPVAPSSPLLNREARAGVERWLARFSPYLDSLESLPGEDCRKRLEELPALRADGQMALERLDQQAAQADAPLVETMRSALAELDNLEGDLRTRLGYLQPGDPEGRVDLEQIQAKLAATAARREVSSWSPTDTLLEGRLQLETSPPNWGAAIGLLIFSLGWNSFTTIHAVLFIGGFMRVIGLFALFFLLFYSMFWAVGLAMAWGAYLSACREQIVLDGRKLTLTRKLLGMELKREYTLMEGARARLIDPMMKSKNGSTSGSGKDLALLDERGKEIRFASGRTILEQERLMRRLNEYLTARGDLQLA
jgi:hypothetical protein